MIGKKEPKHFASFSLIFLASIILFPSVSEKPRDLDESFRNAARELDWQYLEEAERSYVDILDHFPERDGIHDILGYIDLRRGNFQEAIRHLKRALADKPGNPLARLLLGISHLQAGEMTTAWEWINASPKYSLGEFDKRLPKKFISDNPGLLPFLKGLLFKENGEWRSSLKMMAAAAGQGYPLAEILVQMVDLYSRQEDEQLVSQALTRLESENFLLARAMGTSIHSRDTQKVVEFARSRRTIVRLCHESIATIVLDLNASAQSALARGDVENALKIWERALYLDDRSFILHYNVALVYCLHNLIPESLHHCLCAIRLGESVEPLHQSWALNLAGNILFEMGQFEEARDYYQQALNLAPKSNKYHNNLGAAYWKLGDVDHAEREWWIVIRNAEKGMDEKDALEFEETERIKVFVDVRERSEAIEAMRSLATLYFEKNSLAQARELFEQLLVSIPFDAEAHFMLGRIHMRSGERLLARRHLETSLKHGIKNEEEARKLLAELKSE
ncbi:MAG: tetratricopeptide repeat protein [Candidatus Aminicenantes bacterium]|nr:tetratricopeptide repeat protein [Candidatus Aminicenantes bacterium]